MSWAGQKMQQKCGYVLRYLIITKLEKMRQHVDKNQTTNIEFTERYCFNLKKVDLTKKRFQGVSNKKCSASDIIEHRVEKRDYYSY